MAPKTTKRLEYLLKLTGALARKPERSEGTGEKPGEFRTPERSEGAGGKPGEASEVDPFAWYGLAMEYRTLERYDEALATFEQLRARAPEYVPMYLMCGQMLEKTGRTTDARGWLQAGIEAARRKGDAHALGELESALGALDV